MTPETRTEYRYDAADRLLEIRRRRHDAAEGGEPEVIRFSYDSAGNLLSEETAQGVLQHRYDVQGNRTETQMPDGRTLRYLYYGSGHLQQINLGRDVISEFTRDHLHREVQRSQGRLDTRRMYDRTGRLTRKLTCKGMRGVVPETFIDREYAYSGQDELLKKRHSRQGVTDYFYDTTGRITACRNEAYLDSWQYDAAANLLDRRQGETAQAGAGSVVPFNRITSYRGLHYRYDEYGRVVEKRGRNGTQHYRWDAEHRLTEVAVIRGSTVRRYGYVYDAPGRRVEKHELDAEGKPYNRTTFLWDGMRLAQECRLGRSSSLYIYSDQGSHEPLARVDRAAPGEADEVLYYHTDVNGAPEEMTDGGGNIVWEAGYQVWGNLTHEKETRPVQQNLRFQGQYLDRETGLHYNLYRFYDPDIGKFISGDPISLRGGINLYAYAPNPLSWIDPLGLANRPNNGKYNIFHDYSLDPKYKYSSDGVQFNRANTDFINRMNSDPSFRRDMLGRHPALGDWLKNPNKASSPPGLTWHHHEDVNRLVLVDRIDHADNQGLYHPTGKGGRDMWGGGELGRRGKLDGVTGKPRGRRCG
ncbi:Rhs-family protein [Salmonella enterica subsp. enterica serovar Infantis]|nr:Rhs-family protein [Salmonella enterica subsp. enterica serovar Infantis]ECN4242702.1 Rhs-family protein [Salmonella enterica subsp. enterica serovar Infantis]ECY3662307.1 Rhs-family protein [Salmonella enterica subsp. enterica serovar Infantis]EEK7248765.1 Rhs-family protein [Salmonella enterica subsp. enterica serovar Infantis]